MSNFFTDTHLDYPDPEPMYTGQVKAVSFSTLSKFEQCPYSVYLSKVTGIPGISGAAADRGSKIHDMLENYVLGNIEEVQWSKLKSAMHYAPIIDRFKTEFQDHNNIKPELKFAITQDLKPTDWDADNCWLRGAIDVVEWLNKIKAKIYDYKTGQDSMAAKHRSQLMLYALIMFILYPELEEIESAAIYLDLKKDLFFTKFTREDLNILWPRYYDRLNKVTNCRDFTPNPNNFTCRWCQHKTAHKELNQTEPACKFAYGT